jgi:predicted ATPase
MIKDGKGQVALLCGEAGIGKSRLGHAFLDRVKGEPHITITYQCSPYHINSPFFPIISQLEQAAQLSREDVPDGKLQKLELEISKAGAACLQDLPLFTTLLSIPSALPDMTPQRQRDLTIAALIRHILALAHNQPIVLMLEDAHWADSSTLELFNRCIDAIISAPIFALVTFRPEFFPLWLDRSHITMLRLNRLTREQTRAIATDVAGRTSLSDEVYEQIVIKSDGVPLFAEELTKGVLESGQSPETTSQGALLPVPTTLLGSLIARLDKLGPVKEIVQIAAAIGREFSRRLLLAVAPISGPALEVALSQLLALELVFVRPGSSDQIYTFKHALVQDAVYEMMVQLKRQQLHRRIADTLAQQFPETLEAQPEVISYHLEQAGLLERAIDYLGKAGQRAIERSANTEAIAHLTHAVGLLKSLCERPEHTRVALGLEVMLAQAMIARFGYAAPQARDVSLRAKRRIDNTTEPSKKFAVLYICGSRKCRTDRRGLGVRCRSRTAQ